jgi:hypothetical protein
MRYSALLVIGLATFGCSLSEDDGDSPGSGSTNGNGGGSMIGLPGAGNTGNGDTPGSTDLPPAEVDRLRNSACAGWSAEPEAVPSILELVVDVSSSMNQQARGTNRSKWEVTREALLEAIVGVNGPGLPASMAVGLLFYPNRSNASINAQPGDLTGCVRTDAMVDISLMGDQRGAHRRLLESSFRDVQLQSSTPTHDAFRFALNSGILPSRLPGAKYMLLITDGEPTLSLGCVNPSGSLQAVDPRPIVEEVRTAAQKYVKTFLIGSPGSENNRRWMSEAARIGGTAQPGCSDDGPNYCHMDLTTSSDFSAALRAGLAQVTGQIVSCTYDIPPPPAGQTINSSHVNVIFTPSGSTSSQLIGRSSASNCTEGWRLEGNQVTICPDTCDAIQQDQGASLELLFGCAGVEVPPR